MVKDTYKDSLSLSEPLRILIIKHSALGDFLMAIGAMAAIRKHYPTADLFLLTTAPYKELGEKTGFFKEVWVDQKPRLYQIEELWHLRRRLREARFTWVYDLQNTDRTALYFSLFSRRYRPFWSGKVKKASHYYIPPSRPPIHKIDQLQEQLYVTGIDHVDLSDLHFLDREGLERFNLKRPFCLFAIGASARHPEKCWEASYYGEVAGYLRRRRYTIVLVGTAQEESAARVITAGNAGVVNLVGKTGVGDLVALGRAAAFALGNDTGPMHAFALAGCPVLTLFSGYTDPRIWAPRAPEGVLCQFIQRPRLKALSVDHVCHRLAPYLVPI